MKIQIKMIPPTPRFPRHHFALFNDQDTVLRFKPYISEHDKRPLIFVGFKEAIEFVRANGDIPYADPNRARIIRGGNLEIIDV